MPILSAGEAVVQALLVEDVRYIFGVVGSSYLEILDAMYEREDIKFVGCRHEQGAGFMSLGYARASGKNGRMPSAKWSWGDQPCDNHCGRPDLSYPYGHSGWRSHDGTNV